MRILTDFHHSSLMRAHVMLFEDRLGHEVFRPIGMDWFHEGYWAINDLEPTARQFLAFDSQPFDSTPPLNDSMFRSTHVGIARVFDPGRATTHMAVTLEGSRR